MLFYKDIENIVFSKHTFVECDELIILSGYVGPAPVHKLGSLPIKATVIYGMYGCDGIHARLHSALIHENQSLKNIEILYSTLPVHSKLYIWKKNSKIQSAMIGSANFSTNGLTTPYKEVLADAMVDSFGALSDYLSVVMQGVIPCDQGVVKTTSGAYGMANGTEQIDPNVCELPLYYVRKGHKVVHERSGLNWGFANAHTADGDAYIAIRTEDLRNYPQLFPPKQPEPLKLNPGMYRKNHRHNDSIDILWDDGTNMIGLLEGTQLKEIDGKEDYYPKQISSTPTKAELGKYLRKRLGVQDNEQITIDHLNAYGRDTISVSLLGEGVYYFDFSV